MKKNLFILLFCLGIIIRFFHLGENIESPHTWRQSDTANYIWDFYQNGIDLFNPAVCWMGGHKTLILEFPLTEAIVSFFYHVFGPSHTVAKIIFLLFFIGSCYYLYKVVERFLKQDIARIATLIYLFAPLSQFYSRAVHVDYAEMFFALGMVHFYLKGILQQRVKPLFIGSLFAILAFVTKAPYAILFSIPLLGYIISKRKLLFVLKKSYLFVFPVLVFVLWQNHVFAINESAPDWFYVPGYRKFTHNAGWYYGGLSQRFDVNNWELILGRISNEILGVLGLVFGTVGLIFGKRNRYFFVLWLVGVILYLLLFFNLNRVHNYYQIPFVPILSIFIGQGIFYLSNLFNRKTRNVLIVLLVLLYAVESTNYAEKNYYKVQYLHLDIGKAIKENTKEEDLVIVNFENYDSKCPNFLYAAKRNGWGVPEWGLKGEIIYKLMTEGADYFASVRRDTITGEMKVFLNSYPVKEIPLRDGYKLYLYRINFQYIWDILPSAEKEKIKNKALL